MCVKLPPEDLNFGPYPPPTPHKHLYLWNDYRTKGVRWYLIKLYHDNNNPKVNWPFVFVTKIMSTIPSLEDNVSLKLFLYLFIKCEFENLIIGLSILYILNKHVWKLENVLKTQYLFRPPNNKLRLDWFYSNLY